MLLFFEVNLDNYWESAIHMNNIFFYWDDFNNLPKKYLENVEYISKSQQNFQVQLLDSSKAETEISAFDQELYGLYQQIRIPAAKSDIIRLVLLYNYGGWYFDCDIKINTPLSSFDENEIILFKRDDRNMVRAINGAMYMPKGTHILQSCLLQIKLNLKNNTYPCNVWKATGPGVLKKVLEESDYPLSKMLSYKAFFLAKGAKFTMLKSNETNSWSFQQAFGLLKTSPPNFDLLPNTFDEKVIGNILSYIENHELEYYFMPLLHAKYRYYFSSKLFRKVCFESLQEIKEKEILYYLYIFSDSITEKQLIREKLHNLSNIVRYKISIIVLMKKLAYQLKLAQRYKELKNKIKLIKRNTISL